MSLTGFEPIFSPLWVVHSTLELQAPKIFVMNKWKKFIFLFFLKKRGIKILLLRNIKDIAFNAIYGPKIERFAVTYFENKLKKHGKYFKKNLTFLNKEVDANLLAKKKIFYFRNYFSNCTFPYNYLVTTSSQLVNHLHELLAFEQKAKKPLFPFAANYLSDRDGRFVQSPSTNSPQLCWFAITSDSPFICPSCRTQSVKKTF